MKIESKLFARMVVFAHDINASLEHKEHTKAYQYNIDLGKAKLTIYEREKGVEVNIKYDCHLMEQNEFNSLTKSLENLFLVNENGKEVSDLIIEKSPDYACKWLDLYLTKKESEKLDDILNISFGKWFYNKK